MKKIGIILLVLVIGGYFLLHNRSSIVVDEDKSFFSDYYVEENIVKIKCYVTIKNTFHHTVKYELVAESPIDYERGLLAAPKLYVEGANGEKKQYTISQDSEDSFYVIFTGEFGGLNEKQDRLLPDIKIIVI